MQSKWIWEYLIFGSYLISKLCNDGIVLFKLPGIALHHCCNIFASFYLLINEILGFIYYLFLYLCLSLLTYLFICIFVQILVEWLNIINSQNDHNNYNDHNSNVKVLYISMNYLCFMTWNRTAFYMAFYNFYFPCIIDQQDQIEVLY